MNSMVCTIGPSHATYISHEIIGIVNVNADLRKQLVAVEGTAAPSKIVSAIQSTGRDAILRGSGKSNSNDPWPLTSIQNDGLLISCSTGAAVSILETHAPGIPNPVRGLARMVRISPKLTIVDLTVRGLSPGTYYATIRQNGDISRGAASTGGVWQGGDADEEPSGNLGEMKVDKSGNGSVLLDRPVEISELIGRSFVVSQRKEGLVGDDKDTVCGVIARSAGVWENDKTVSPVCMRIRCMLADF